MGFAPRPNSVPSGTKENGIRAAPEFSPVRDERKWDSRRVRIASRQGRQIIAHHFSGGNPRIPQTTSPVGTADNRATTIQNRRARCVPRWRGWPRGPAWPKGDANPAILGEGSRACSTTPFGGWIVVVRMIPGLRPGRLTVDPVPASTPRGQGMRSPSRLMTTSSTGTSLVAISRACLTRKVSPWQQGTTMRATVTLRGWASRNSAVSLSR